MEKCCLCGPHSLKPKKKFLEKQKYVFVVVVVFHSSESRFLLFLSLRILERVKFVSFVMVATTVDQVVVGCHHVVAGTGTAVTTAVILWYERELIH